MSDTNFRMVALVSRDRTYKDAVRIHLAKELNSIYPSCSVRPQFNTIYVANNPEKVTCMNCKKIIESLKRVHKSWLN